MSNSTAENTLKQKFGDDYEKAIREKAKSMDVGSAAKAFSEETGENVSHLSLFMLAKNLGIVFPKAEKKISPRKGKRGGKKPTILPKLIEHYGGETEFYDRLRELATEGKSAIEATEIVKEETGIKFSTVQNWADKQDIAFARKNRRTSKVIDTFVEKAGGKEKAKELLQEFSSKTLKEAAEEINEKIGLDYDSQKLRYVGQSFDIEFKPSRRKKEIIEGELVPVQTGTKTRVTLECQSCNRTVQRTVYIDDHPLPMIKGTRCTCGQWESQVATYEIKGETVRRAVVPVEMGDGIKVQMESFVDEDLNPITETIDPPVEVEDNARKQEEVGG